MSLIIQVKVTPSAGKNKWVLDKSGILKCFLKSPASKGLANEELIKTLAKMLKLGAGQVTLISGQTMRMKRIKIDANLSLQQLLQALGVYKEEQLHLF